MLSPGSGDDTHTGRQQWCWHEGTTCAPMRGSHQGLSTLERTERTPCGVYWPGSLCSPLSLSYLHHVLPCHVPSYHAPDVGVCSLTVPLPPSPPLPGGPTLNSASVAEEQNSAGGAGRIPFQWRKSRILPQCVVEVQNSAQVGPGRERRAGFCLSEQIQNSMRILQNTTEVIGS